MSGSKTHNDNTRIQYRNVRNWFKTLSIPERNQYNIELMIDIYFMEYDESEPVNE